MTLRLLAFVMRHFGTVFFLLLAGIAIIASRISIGLAIVSVITSAGLIEWFMHNRNPMTPRLRASLHTTGRPSLAMASASAFSETSR